MNLTDWDGECIQSLAQALRLPAVNCVEADAMACGRWQPTRDASRRLSVTLTTRSAYRHAVSKTVVDALDGRLSLPVDLRERVHIALQEALMNAVLHGNMALDSTLRRSLTGLAKWQALIETALLCPTVARSIIRLDAHWTKGTLWIAVRDSGAGFDRATVGNRSEVTSGSGRGLAILDALCDEVTFRHSGTTVEMKFRR